LGLGRFFSFLILYTVGWLLGRGISLPQGRYLHTEQHKHRINAQTSMPRTDDPTVRAGEGSSCLRPRGHCDRHPYKVQEGSARNRMI
jgi:hypothetical protein